MSERRINYLAFIPLIIIIGFIAAVGWAMYERYRVQLEGGNPDALPLALKGQTVPELVLQEMNMAPGFTTQDLKSGGVKLVNFWASWCGPCRVEHPTLMALEAEGIPIYGINYKDDPSDAAAFVNELGDPYIAMGADRSGRNGINWGVIAMPETFVIDGDGTILYRHAGPLTSRVVEGVLRPALEAAGG